MKLSTKIQLANIAAKLMLISAMVFAFSLMLFILFMLFQSFIGEKVREWTLILFAISGAAAIVSGVVYVGLSLNIPHENRFNESDTIKKSNVVRNTIIIVAIVTILVFVAIVTVDCISKKNHQKEVEKRVDMLVEMYKSSINELPLIYTDTAQVNTIFGKIAVMNKQTNLSDIYIIFIDNIENIPTLVALGGWDYYETLPQTGFKDYVYQCSTDCDYLISYFNGAEPQPFILYEYNTWYIYKPFESHGKRFVLRFSGS